MSKHPVERTPQNCIARNVADLKVIQFDNMIE